MKTLILFVVLGISLDVMAQDFNTNPCRAISGIVETIRGSTATLKLPEGGNARVSTLCLPEGATTGVVIVRGRVIRPRQRR